MVEYVACAMRRRNFLVGIGTVTGTSVVGTAKSAGPNLTLRGGIRKPDNRPAEGHLVQLRIVSLEDRDVTRRRILTGPGGRFEYELEEPSTVEIVHWSHRDERRQPVRDGVPDLYWMDRIVIEDGPVNVNERLPEGHLVNVKVVDQNGDPVEGAGVRIATCKGEGCRGWFGSGRHPTDEDGWFVYRGVDHRGMEMNGPVFTNVYHPDEEWSWSNHRDEAVLDVDGPIDHVFEIDL